MKKKLAVLLAFVILTVSFASGVFAADKIMAIKAYLNQALSIEVNGTKIQPTETDGSRIYPIVYNGRTYVPARAIAEALGATVDYNNSGDGTVIINSSSDDSNGRPIKDGTPTGSGNTPATPTPAPTPTSAPTTTANGSLESPIPINQKFTRSSKYTYNDISYSGTYSATVKSAKKITVDAIKDLGFKVGDDDAAKFDYMLVTLSWEVKNAKCISASSDYPYMYLSQFDPDIWGSEVKDGSKYVIGGTDYGFDASISEKVRAATNLKKLNIGDSASFSAEGQVILPIVKNTTSCLIIQDAGTRLIDYEKSKIRFKLN